MSARAGEAQPRGRALLALSLSVALLVVSVVLSLAFGEVASPWSVIVSVRLPRVLLGLIAGAGLSAVGVALQALLRNPLAEPYVLGVSGGSALGAVVVIALGATELTLVGASLIPVAALLGGLAATAIVYALASNGRGNATSLLLSGVIVNAIASAAITFLKTLVTAGTAQEMLYWLMGFLDAPVSNAGLAFVAGYVAIGLLVLLVDAGRLNLLALGPSAAMNLGLDVRALERRTLLACSLIVGAITSASGMIGFIGLIVPHAVRRVAGPDIRVVLPASIIGGAATLVLCDLVSRLCFRLIDRQIPVGAVTALIGGPLFLVILWRSRARLS